jgi:hypothetical protein
MQTFNNDESAYTSMIKKIKIVETSKLILVRILSCC